LEEVFVVGGAHKPRYDGDRQWNNIVAEHTTAVLTECEKVQASPRIWYIADWTYKKLAQQSRNRNELYELMRKEKPYYSP
jgi:hypothetical protein